jgi:uncharacterized protein YjbJ (UPF0337 family)
MGTDNKPPVTEWKEIKSKIKTKWQKLGDSDIEKFKDNMHLVSAKVQNVYGISKDKAEQEYAEFKKTINLK